MKELEKGKKEMKKVKVPEAEVMEMGELENMEVECRAFSGEE